jgi:hypothetical protein
MQFTQQALKPASMPTGFHSHAYLQIAYSEIAIELLRLLAVLQSALA